MFEYDAPKDLLNDQKILVTGAGDGIGKTAALTFAEHGATVILLGRTTKKLEDTYDLIEEKGYPQAAIYPMNLEGASPKDYFELAQVIEKEFGVLDGLLHNAATLGNLSPIEHYPIEDWFKVMHVNVNAAFMLTQALLPLLARSKAGRIVFTSSGVASKPRAYWGAYAASKAAADNFMMTLADELGPGNIRCNSINPGATRTAMRKSAFPAEDENKLVTPDQLMPAYLYLLGRDSQDVNGQVIHAQA